MLQPETIRDGVFLEKIRSVAPDVIVVVAYGKILPGPVLDAPRLGCVNVHASLLPRYRGAAPVNWAIIRGETRTGVTIMRMDEGMDTGDIICQEETAILDDDDARSVADMLSVLGANLLMETLEEGERKGEIECVPQEPSQVTLAPILKKEDGRIDWSRTTEQIVCLVRGATPWPSAFTASSRGMLKILRAEPLWNSACAEIDEPEKIAAATVALAMKSHGFAVRTADGFLLVSEAQLEGKRAMSGVDLLNGKLIQIGDVLA